MNYYNSETLVEQEKEIYTLKQQNAELVAQAEALRKLDGKLRSLCDELIDHLRYNKSERPDVLDGFWSKLESIELPATPAQCLLEVKAGAGRAGFIEGYDSCWFQHYGTRAPEHATAYSAGQYANKICGGE